MSLLQYRNMYITVANGDVAIWTEHDLIMCDTVQQAKQQIDKWYIDLDV